MDLVARDLHSQIILCHISKLSKDYLLGITRIKGLVAWYHNSHKLNHQIQPYTMIYFDKTTNITKL